MSAGGLKKCQGLKKEAIVLFLLLGLILATQANIDACEPCKEVLDFENTVERADLIIVGRKIENGPNTFPYKHLRRYTRPDWIKVKVVRTLKGVPSSKWILVNSWDGKCKYGLVLDDELYVMFLRQRSVSGQDYQYDAVNYGCSVKNYLVENGSVDFQGIKISMNSFIFKLK